MADNGMIVDRDAEHRQRLLDAFAQQTNNRVGSHSRPNLLGDARKFNVLATDRGLADAREEAQFNINTEVWPIIQGSGGIPVERNFSLVTNQIVGSSVTVYTDPEDGTPLLNTFGYTDAVNFFVSGACTAGGAATPIAVGAVSLSSILEILDTAGDTLATYTITYQATNSNDGSQNFFLATYAMSFTPPNSGWKGFNALRLTTSVLELTTPFTFWEVDIAGQFIQGNIKTVIPL